MNIFKKKKVNIKNENIEIEDTKNENIKNEYIKSLHVRGFRSFNELNVNFNRGFNFIIGSNGCGKTSLLRAIILSYSDIIINDSRYEEDFETWIDIVKDSKINRIGIIPDKKESQMKNLYRAKPVISNSIYPPKEGVDNFYQIYDIDKLDFCPLVLGAFRKIEYKQIEGMRSEKNIDESRKAYINTSVERLYGGILPDVKQWMINRYFQIDKEWAVIERSNWEWLISNLNILSPSDVKFEFLKIERELEPMFKVNDKICYLEELSSGFQSVLSIVLSIFEWIETTNSKEESIVKNATGTVLIDELDVHLHPEWQLTLKNSLKTIFPNLQFIVTTHSPHMIATADKGEIIILDTDHNGKLNLTVSDKSYNGWNTDQILEEIMGVRSLSNKVYEELVNQGMKNIEDKDIESLKKTIHDLEEISHPSDTITSVLKIKLAELQLEG